MQIRVSEPKAIKELTPAIRKEMVWRELCRVQDTINYLYRRKEGLVFDDEKMEKIFYEVNDMCLSLLGDGDLDFQIEEQNEK